MAESPRNASVLDTREGSSVSNTSKRTGFGIIRDGADTVYFATQLIVIVLVVFFSLYNLTINSSDKHLWTAVLTGVLGYLLPNPKISKPFKLEQNE